MSNIVHVVLGQFTLNQESVQELMSKNMLLGTQSTVTSQFSIAAKKMYDYKCHE